MKTASEKKVENLSEALRQRVDPVGTLLMDGFHFIALFGIGMATFWSAGYAFLEMMHKSHATVEDLLLLFIYLEIGSMVGIYFKTNHMPLRFVVYVAITAVTRHLIGYVNHESKPDYGVLILAGAILILALAVVAIRFASAKYGSSPGIAAFQNLSDSETEAKRTD